MRCAPIRVDLVAPRAAEQAHQRSDKRNRPGEWSEEFNTSSREERRRRQLQGRQASSGEPASQELTAPETLSSSRTGGSGCPVSRRVFRLSKILTQPSLTFSQVRGLCSRLLWTSRTRVSPSPASWTVHSTRLGGSADSSGS